MKKLLIMGANPETASLVIKANEMGIYTIVTDYDPNAFAKRFASKAANVDACDLEGIKQLAIREQVDGIVLGVAEALMMTYQKACEDLGFPCYGSSELFQILADKEKFKAVCREYDVPVVEEGQINYETKGLENIQLPVVVKPVDSSSSKGISVCSTHEELVAGIEKALSFSKSKRLLIEKYMRGPEVVIYYAFQDGEPVLITMCDRYTNKEQKGVAQLPTAYIYPSKHIDRYVKETDEKVKAMFRNIGVKNGVMFIQSFIDDDGGVKFYEPGYRLNGAQEHFIVSAATGIDAKEMMIHFALTGKMSESSIAYKANPKLGLFGCKLSPLIKTGKIKKILGLDTVQSLPGVISVNPSYNDGDTVAGYGTLKQIVCRFFVIADTPTHLKERIDTLMNQFDVLDDNDDSMLLTPFNTEILRNEY